MSAPYTDDVRDAYIDTMGKCGFSETEAGVGFDLWLNEIRAEAWKEGARAPWPAPPESNPYRGA